MFNKEFITAVMCKIELKFIIKCYQIKVEIYDEFNKYKLQMEP